MKCQILFYRKNKKNSSECHLLNFLPSMLKVRSNKDGLERERYR